MAKSASTTLSTNKLTPINTDCTVKNMTIYVSYFIFVIILIVIITSLNNLEHSNCKCANLPHRRFLKEWFTFAIFVLLTVLILFGISNEACWDNFVRYPYIFVGMLIFGLINFIMLIRLFLYVRVLRQNCSCGYGNKEKFIYWYLVIVFSIYIVIFILFFILALLAIIKFSSYR